MNPIFGPPPRELLSRLETLSEPLYQVLSRLIHEGATDPETRTILATALVLSTWQLGGRGISRNVPSMLLLNAAEEPQDPIDAFAREYVHPDDDNRPNESCISYDLSIIKPGDARRIMCESINRRRALGLTPEKIYESNALGYEREFRMAQRAGFGGGPARPYAKAWIEPFGLITEASDELILRLNDATDRSAFRRDLLENPDNLRAPKGIGLNLWTTTKSVSVSGSLTVDQWDEQVAEGIIRLGLPIIMLPHTATQPVINPNRLALGAQSMLWPKKGVRVDTDLFPPHSRWFGTPMEDVRRRLRLLPGCGTYEFAVRQVIHQIGGVCFQIAVQSCIRTGAPSESVHILHSDLYPRALHGISLGVAALAWHCLGFDPGCPRKKALKVLRHIREKGTVAKSDLLLAKGSRVDATTRDVLLERLAAEDLIRVEGKTVTATSFSEFVKALHARPELPNPETYRAPGPRKGRPSA